MATQCLPKPTEPSDSLTEYLAIGRESSLTFKEKSGYALGDTAFVLFWHTWSQFLLIFYTDVFGITAMAAGAMFFVTRLVDAFADPIMGLIADQTKSRHGKFRPWLIWGVIPYMVLGVLLFTVPNLAEGGKLIYAYVTYIGVSIVYTVLNIPYSALMGVMTSHSHERTVLASYRFYGAYIAVFIVNLTLLKMVSFFGDGDDATGYQRTMMVYSLIAGVLILIVFLATKERVQPPQGQNSDLKADLAQLFKNGPLLAVILIGVLTLVWTTLRNSATLYYMKYYIGADDAATSLFLTVGTISVLISVAATGLAERWLGGKKKAFVILTLATGIVTCGYFFADGQNVALLYAIVIISQAFTAPLMPLFWSMIADTADYSEWKFGRRTTGLIFSSGTFSQKSGGAIGGALAGMYLAWIGYDPKIELTAASIDGLRAMMSYVPSAIGVVAAAAVVLYSISPSLAKQIERDLSTRHAISSN
jgi:glycoside/pentoside/hexuronide:cation symporter, GPH family